MQAHQLSSSATRDVNALPPIPSIAQGRGLAHDARNLLGALGLYCDLLDLPGVLQPRHRHYARELRLLSQRSGALIEQLLVEQGTHAAFTDPSDSSEVADAGAIMRQFAPLLRFLAEPHATVSTACAANLPGLPFEAEVLERIIVNLTRNAATALRFHRTGQIGGTAPEGQIHIALCGGENYLRLSVLDNGPGMTPGAVAAFLNPPPLAPDAVCGIGHRVVHELVRSTGGTIEVVVTPRRGTMIQIDWPTQPRLTPAIADRRKAARRRLDRPPAGTDRARLPNAMLTPPPVLLNAAQTA